MEAVRMMVDSVIRRPRRGLKSLAQEVLDAAEEVHRLLGPAYPEVIYERALTEELNLRGVNLQKRRPIGIQYKGVILGENRRELLIDDRLVVKVKAVDEVAPLHQAQLYAYMKAARKPLGIMINFREPVLEAGVHHIVL
jgi:GxxExxY protein